MDVESWDTYIESVEKGRRKNSIMEQEGQTRKTDHIKCFKCEHIAAKCMRNQGRIYEDAATGGEEQPR